VSHFDRFWLAPASAERLATLRVACGTFSTIYLLVRARVLIDFGAVTAAQWEPVGIANAAPGPLPAALVIALWAACVACAIAFTLGARYRLTGPAFGLLFLWVTSYRSSFGMIFHNDNMAVLHALALGACPAAAEALSFDARGRAAPEDHGRFGWPIKLVCAVTAATYVIAGVAKLRGAGLHWADGDILRHYVAYDAVRKQALGSTYSPLGAWLAQYAWPFPAFSALTLVLELGAPLALAGRRIAAIWTLGIWGFHVSVLLLMAIAFPYPLTVGLLCFLPAERVWQLRGLRRAHAWLARGLPRGAVVACVLAMLSACGEPPAARAGEVSPTPTPDGTRAAQAASTPTAVPPAPAPPPSRGELGIDGRSMPSPTAGDALDFEAVVGERVLPDGLLVEPSATLPASLVVRDRAGTFRGTLELVASDSGDLAGELDDHYLKYARNVYALLQSERAAGDPGPGSGVETDEPAIVRVGRLRGVRYGFSERQGKTLLHRTLSVAFVQGDRLYVMVASAPARADADSSFATLEGLAAFEPHLPALLESLRLPAP